MTQPIVKPPMRPLEWIRQGMHYVPEGKDWPLPEDLQDLPVQGHAEGRSRLGHAGVVAYGIRRSVDQVMIQALGPYGALRYGDTFMQVGRDATRKVSDHSAWWKMLANEVRTLPVEDGARLLAALFNANNVKVTGFPMLAKVTGASDQGLRGTFLEYQAARHPWKVNTPRRADWPDWAERLGDGQAVITKASFPEVPPELKQAARAIEDGREGTT